MVNHVKNFIVDYSLRHKHSFNLFLHLIGIPFVVLGLIQLFAQLWFLSFAFIFIGYFFQWVGHHYFEKNEVGEVQLLVFIWRKIRGVFKNV